MRSPLRPRRGLRSALSLGCALGTFSAAGDPASQALASESQAPVWAAETIQFRTGPENDPLVQFPVDLMFDGAGRPLVAWTESAGSGRTAMGWWARREEGRWQVHPMSRAAPSGVFSLFDPNGGVALALSTNQTPFLFYGSANFANQDPYFISRANLETAPEGPGSFVALLRGSGTTVSAFDADGRASHPPDIVSHSRGWPIQLNGNVNLTGNILPAGMEGELVFRQGPQRQIHVLYQADNQLRYNGGAPDRDLPILTINGGSSPHAMAIDDANGIHVSAAQGTGRFFFGAVGQLVYLHSVDGTTWTTNTFTQVPPDVGATAIALDSKGQPGIAFTRAFSSLFFTRRTDSGWTAPSLIRTGLGGWDRSRSVLLAFGPGDVPHIAVHDHLSKRLLIESGHDSSLRTDLALNATASTNRVGLGSELILDLTVTNAGPRHATASRLRVQLPPELIVRDVTPRPTQIVGSVHTFDLGTVYALEPRPIRFTVSALDPVRACVEATVETETGETNLANNDATFCLAEFLPSPCLNNPAAAGCQDLALLPSQAPPALAHQPWSLAFHAPLAPPGSRLQLSATTLLSPGFCFTAEGELRGFAGEPGTIPIGFDVVEPGGRITSFLRDITVASDSSPQGLIAFWPLDGHGLDTVRGVGATLGPRGTFLPGPTGLALQSARDALNDPRDDLARPAPLFTSPALLDGAAFGKGPVTVTGWFRRDNGARSRGDARPFGYVLALVENETWTRERFLAWDPASGRLDVLDGPPDTRANILRGPILPAGIWHHLAMVCEGTSVRVYTNGVLSVQGNFRQPLVDHPRLMAGGWALGGEFSGALDELALYQRALGPSDLETLRSTPLPRQTPLPAGTEFPIAATVHDLVLPDAPLGEPYQATLAAAFCGTPESLTLVQGALPAGLALDSKGILRGASTTLGTSHFRVRGIDAAQFTAELNVSITTREGLPVFTRQPTDQQLEAGSLLILFAETRQPASFQWFVNGRALRDETNALLAIPEFSLAQAGRFQLRASNPTGATWSQEVRVGLRTTPTAPPSLDVAPIAIRPDGVVRLRLETLRGRVYELQRATDLGAAISGAWRTVQRFLSHGGSREFTDVIAGRPDAAFYRIVEVLPPPASPFSTEDATRFVGIAQDGEIRPGLLPAEDPATGRLGAFEFRVGGEQVPLDQGLILRLPDGAQPVNRDGQTALRFRTAELFFGDESPVQLNENGTNRVILAAAAEQEIPSGPLSVEVLERLLGKPQGSGVGLTFFRHFHFRLLSGTFDGTRIRNAQMAWADRAGGLPTPDRTGNGFDFDIELTATHLRLPFYGEFTLPDSSGAPAKLVVSKASPLWVELRPGPEIALGGRAKASFGNGPEFDVDFRFDQPVFRASLAAKRFRLPENLSLRRFLPALPAPLGPASPALAQEPPSTNGIVDHMPGNVQRIARAQCAGSSVALRLLGDSNPAPDFTRPAGLNATDDELAARDFTQEALAELKAWACVVEAAGGIDELIGVADSTVFEVLKRSMNSSVEDASPIVPRGAEIGPMTYAYRTTLLGEVAAMAIAGYPNELNLRFQPYVDQAFESLRSLTDVNPDGWDTTTLIVAAKGIAKALAVGERNPFILPPDRTQFLVRSFEALIHARGDSLRRELEVARGTYIPDDNPTILELHRWEAMARIRQALNINALAQYAGLPAGEGDPVGADVLGQLAHHAWRQIKRIVQQSTNSCTPTGFHTVLAAGPDIARIAQIADSLRILGITNDLPQPMDAVRLAMEAEQHCANAQPPVPIINLLRNDPENLTARAEAHLALLEGLPVSINSLTPEVAAGIAAAGESLGEVLNPARAIRLKEFGGSQLIRILQVALRHDELRRRFNLTAEPNWLGQQLPTLTRLIREKGNGGEGPVVLADYNELLLAAAIRQQTNVTRQLSLQHRRSHSPPASSPVDSARLSAYYEASRSGVEALTDAVLQLGAHLDGSSANALADLADIRLPGGLTVEQAYGEVTYHHGHRRLNGAFGGNLRIPGAGLHLNLVRAEFNTGGSFSGELHGSLALPPTRPLATLSIPATRPARLAWTRGHAPSLSGGGRLRLENGATLDCFLSLEDPVYRFSAAASSIRLGFTRNALEHVGIPFANQLPTTATSQALHYLSRLGLVLEGAQPDPTGPATRETLRRPERRPEPSDSDDVAANAAALRLLTTTDTLNVPPTNLAAVASSHLSGPRLLSSDSGGSVLAPAQPGPTPPTVLSNGATLVRVLVEQLERASAAIESDTAALTGLDQALLQNATPVPTAEILALRGPKLVEVARRLGRFGADFADAASALNVERGREILGSASITTTYEAAFRSYLTNTLDGLLALRSNLLVRVATPRPGRAPWNPSEHWDRTAATNALAASLRFEVQMQQLGFNDAALSQTATEVGCDVLQTLVDERLTSLGLDPATGAIPTSGGALATYLALDHEQAREALQDLLLYESWLQSAPACQPPSSARLHAGIAATALRLRDVVVDDLQDALDRIDPATAKAWERPERILAHATNLFPAITLPESLGITRYPVPTFPILPRQPGQTIDDPRTDATDLLEILGTAYGQLARLIQDESSGYPAELRRRRASPLPAAGLVARLLARYVDLPGVAATREPLGQLARFEASLLQAQTSAPDFATRMGRDAAQLVLRVLNTARLLDESPSGSERVERSPHANGSPLRLLTDSVLANVDAATRANIQQPWWVASEASRALLDATEIPWKTPGITQTLHQAARDQYATARSRIASLTPPGTNTLAPDLALPGEIEIRRLYGSLLVNRETHFILFEVGGRLEFPLVRTGPGQTAFIDLRRLRLESNGRFAFEAATRTPLPFPEASFAGSFQARGDFPNRALALAGEGTLTFRSAPTNPDTGIPFPNSLSASASYEPIGYDPQGRPEGWRFSFNAGGTFRRSFGTHFAVFGAGAGLVAGQSTSGNPIAGVSVGGSVGLFRKADRLTVEPPLPADFHLVVENAQVEIVGTANENGSASLTAGTVRLPDFCYPTDLPADLACDAPGAVRTGPSAAIRTPIRLSYAAGGKPRLEGTLRFSHFGAGLGTNKPVALTICQADVGLDANGDPFLDIPKAGLGFTIPSWDRGLIRLQNVHLGLDGRIQGQLFLVEDFDLVRSGDFNVSLLGAPALAHPGNRPPDGCLGTALILEDVPGFDAPRVTLSGGIRVELPANFLSDTNGARVGAVVCGGIRLEPTANGEPTIRAFLDEIGLTGDFAMGPRALSLRRASIFAGNFEGILKPDSEHPFYVSVSGDLQAGPFTFGLTNAQLRYRGLDIPPAFGLEAIRFARDATQPLPPPFAFLPASVEFAELRFKETSLPATEMFRPENIQITTSLRVGLPTVQQAFLGGGVSGLVFNFRENGELIPPAIDGFDLTVSGTAGLKLPVLGDLGGKVRIGGLRRALEHNTPSHIYAVGQLSGTQQAVRLGVLAAFNLAGPIGMCLDVNLGAAGLTLSPTPFQITGASGGYAFLTTDNPCDFSQYFVFDPATGTYQLRQTLELPSLPIGMSWTQFTETLERMAARAEGFASHFDPGSIPLPGATRFVAAGVPPAVEPGVSPGGSSLGSSPVSRSFSQTSHAVSLPASPSPFGCPGDCPPRTVAILCQPHPDEAQFPNRVIFKFSSIPESVLTNARPAGLGIDPASIAQLGSDAPTLARNVAKRLVDQLAGPPPGSSSLPAPVAAFLAEQQQLALEGVRTVATTLIQEALRRSPNAYTAIRDELYKGIPCPDISLALAGRMSIVGLSAFGWVEGRESSSLSGSGGVVGELHMLGVPVGQARAFISTTDANGDPNPSVCGELTAALGPLDLGHVNLALRCEGCVTEMLRLFPTLAHAVGEPFLRSTLERVAPEFAVFADRPDAFLTRLRQQSENDQIRIMLGVFTEIQSAGPGVLPGNLGSIVRDAVADTWSRINPEIVLCGDITPRLLGLPLTLGGRSAALNFLADKTGLIGEFAFSPSALVPLFPPGDEASLSFALRVIDPYTALLNSFDGRLNRADTRNAFIREQAEFALQNMVVAANYQWHPFGLELGDAAIRVLTPDLLDHPALPGRSWRNPDERAAAGLPSRDALLVQAAASGKLGRAFEWIGGTNDLADIFATEDPRGAVLREQRMDLRHDYFPHGGIVGGARMALPRILMAAPNEWKPLHDRALHGTNLFDQIDGALTLLNEYVLRNETNGTAAFYVPAPNPPLLYTSNGRLRSADEIRRAITVDPDAFSPDALMRQIRSLDFSASESLAHLYPDHLAFLRAEMTNLVLMGVPVFGTATLTGRPSPLRVIDGRPLAHLDVQIAGDSHLGKVAGGGFNFGFDLYVSPAESIASWATQMVAELRRQRGGGSGPTLAGGSPSLGTSALTRFQAGLARQLPRFATTNALPPLNIVDPREWAGSGAPTFLADDPFSGGRLTFNKRPPAKPVLRAELALHAFSPFYHPDAPGDGPVADARRQGGLAASGLLEILPETPGQSGTGQAELAITAQGNQPRLVGRVRSLNLPTPFAGISLQNAQADFDSQASTFLRAHTTLPNLAFSGSLFRLESTQPNQPLAASLALRQSVLPGGILAARSELELAPARLSSDLIAGRALIVHGPGHLTNPITVSATRWLARASLITSPTLALNSRSVAAGVSPAVEPGVSPGGISQGSGSVNRSVSNNELSTPLSANPDLVLRADLAGSRRDVVRIAGLPANPFAFEAQGLDRFTACFDASLPGSLTVELFPGLDVPGLPQKTLTLRAPATGQLQLEIDSQDGFTVVGVLAAPFNAGNPGSFGTDAEVRIDSTGATISGRIGTTTGSLQVAAFDNRIEARLSGQLTLPSISALGGRITLAAPDGGDLAVTVDATGTCVSGAVLTLQNFAPNVSPIRIDFPRFCLDANRAFRDLAPAASTPALHAGADPDLPIGAFEFGDLRSLQLSGNFNTRSVSVAFQADLKLGNLLAVPVRGSIGSDGLRFVENASTTRLLGFDFSSLRLGATNSLGDLPDLAFAGRMAALPARLRDVEFSGRIPGTGGFSLMPASPLDLPELIPAFPLLETQPALNYRTEDYAPVVRASDPSGYWSLDEASGAFLDRRLTAFRTGVTRRSGEPAGVITYSQEGAFTTGANRAARFNGTSSHVRLPFDALAPQSDGFAASLWFRRPNNLTLTSPQTLAARGAQWSLHLAEAQAGAGTRIQFMLDGPRLVDGSPSTPLVGRTRVDDLNWHHVVAVHDGVAQYLYLDGNLDAWQPVRGAVTPVAGLVTTFGATLSGTTATRFFSGWLDEIALFPAPLSPLDIQAQGLAAGRSGFRLTGRLEPNRIPGLPAPSLDGILSPNGDVALAFGPGGTGEFGGIRLPEFQGTLLRRGAASTVTFHAGLVAPGLETLPLGIARGVFEGSGVFAAHASSLADRAVFGWNLRLTNLTLTGNWQTRTLASTIGARLTLPYDIASFAVAGDLDTTRNRYTLRGTAGGAFSIGPSLPFSFDAEPILREDLFKLSGRLALGTQADAARFNTSLEVKKSGEVHAGFSGVTDWIGFPGVGFGQLRWKGALAYVEQQPRVGFLGVLGLATPNHPAALEDLPEGLDFNAKGPIAASLRTAEAPITVSARGKASVRAEPSFQGKSYFDFNLP